MSFAHLHRHSEFSRLDGCGTARQYAEAAVAQDQGALALTDHGTLSGALHHIHACREVKIFPIVGVEAYFRPNRLVAPRFRQRKAWHLCLYAKNLRGWHSLLQIVSTAFQDPSDGGGYYQYPCVDWDLLQRHCDGLVCSSACISSWLSELIVGGDHAAVNDYIDRMLNIFGDDFWIEVMPHDFEDQRFVNQILADVAVERSIPLLATNDAHFPIAEWAETQRVAKLCGVASSFQKAEKDKEKGKAEYLAELHPTLFIASEAQMRQWFTDHHPMLPVPMWEEAVANTQEFTSRITPFLLDRTDKLPKVSEDESPEKILTRWIEQGWQRLLDTYPASHWQRWPYQLYIDRIAHEWEILRSKGVIDYFVMIGDVVRWARSEQIRVGLGRGSAAGSLISYLIGIVAIDPIAWGLLFERFLNPERRGLPDIDVDFQATRRNEVKAYLARKYGADHVADIITHARFQPKSVLKAVCRVYDLDYRESNALTNTIDIRQDSEETTLEELLPINPKLREWRDRYPEQWEHAIRLEGTVQNAGVHAAGIVITPKPVISYMALERGKKGDLVTSWSDSADFQAISDNGFVKLDCLGIKGLDKHDYACLLIKKRHKLDVDLNALGPLRDPYDVEDDVLDGFRKGYTTGVFQFAGRGITSLIKSISPDTTFDLAAANALYRPGPMKGGVTWEYARRKNAPEEDPDWYWDDLVKPILSETHGLVTYQEQVMEIAKQLGGFSGAEADDLRKAMGKLYRVRGGRAKEFMRQYEEKWFAGCQQRHIERKVASEIWDKILEFGHYGFNLSHSASYALQAYQDMWLKIHYPLEFYAAFLTYEADEEKAQVAIREARLRGIRTLAPNVNSSIIGWSVDGDALRMGLTSIKGLGEKGAAEIIKERAYGPYEAIDSFRQRVSSKAVNKRALDALVESGAMDDFGAREGATEEQIQIWEKARLGMSLSVVGAIEKHADWINENIYTQDEIDSYASGTSVVIGGEITRIDHKTTKKGAPFANVLIAFELNEWRVKFWKESLARYGHLLALHHCVMVSGKTSEFNGIVSVIANDVTDDFDAITNNGGSP